MFSLLLRTCKILHTHLYMFSRRKYMKRVSLVVAALFVFAIGFSALTVPAQAQDFGSLLIQLETSVKYSSQSDSWRSRRSGWISQVRSCSNLSCYKSLLITFETNVKYDAQSDSWRSRRSGWLSRVRSAGSVSQLGRLMIEVETSIKYSAQSDSWRSSRSGWLSSVRSL